MFSDPIASKLNEILTKMQQKNMILKERKEGWLKQLTDERYVIDDAVKAYMSEETSG